MAQEQKDMNIVGFVAGAPLLATDAPLPDAAAATEGKNPGKKNRNRKKRRQEATAEAAVGGAQSEATQNDAPQPEGSQNEGASLLPAVNGDANGHANGTVNGEAKTTAKSKRKGKAKAKPETWADQVNNDVQAHANGDAGLNGNEVRRMSLSKPARDHNDTPSGPRGPRRQRKKRSPKTQSLIDQDKNDAASIGHDSIATSAASPVIDFDGLSRPSRGTRERLEETPEKQALRLDRMKGAVRTLLECVGEDPDREGLLATPERYAKAMLFFTKGYQENVRDIINNAIFQEGHNEMVVVKDIDVFSVCEHHLVPFTGKMHIGYIPRNAVIGISKLPRIAEMFARRLQIQERLTREVANAIFEVLQPQGVGVVMESSHLCMVMRGVEQTSSSTITSCVLGCFEKREKTRNEFLSLIGVNRR
ncbi:hypothetical protein B0I35DRAFT_446880 [Stachybotrys elegans]|uniref:GTP cyclohydrolase 1 n=1 Tax=Stachybotrys elegans TaxID=80388 RepID=A0A8K0WIL2_9HYPO|nr:hypothetical protein B0I35DRAFT_446880 [Stachybotrys elegans]